MARDQTNRRSSQPSSSHRHRGSAHFVENEGYVDDENDYGYFQEAEYEDDGYSYDDNASYYTEVEDGTVYAQDDEDIAAYQDYVGEAHVAAVNANRTFAEARQFLTDMAKNRCGYYPVVGIAAGPPTGGGTTSFKGGSSKGKGRSFLPRTSGFSNPRPPQPQGKGKGKSKKGGAGKGSSSKGSSSKGGGIRCLICRGPHRAADCPTRTSGGASGNMNIGAVADTTTEDHGYFVAHWDGEDDGIEHSALMTAEIARGEIYF